MLALLFATALTTTAHADPAAKPLVITGLDTEDGRIVACGESAPILTARVTNPRRLGAVTVSEIPYTITSDGDPAREIYETWVVDADGTVLTNREAVSPSGDVVFHDFAEEVEARESRVFTLMARFASSCGEARWMVAELGVDNVVAEDVDNNTVPVVSLRPVVGPEILLPIPSEI